MLLSKKSEKGVELAVLAMLFIPYGLYVTNMPEETVEAVPLVFFLLSGVGLALIAEIIALGLLFLWYKYDLYTKLHRHKPNPDLEYYNDITQVKIDRCNCGETLDMVFVGDR